MNWQRIEDAVPVAGLAFFAGFMVATSLYFPSQTTAQAYFTRCISDGAPKDKCIEKYLLPQEKKP